MHIPTRYQLGIDREHKLKKKFEKEPDEKVGAEDKDEDSGYEEGQDSSTNNLI